MRIVLVDDVPLIRMGLKGVLVEQGHEIVAEAGSAAAAIHEVCTQQPDLLILDYDLGRISGLDVYQSLRAQKKLPNTLMLTAAADVYSLSKMAFETDVQGLLMKQNQQQFLTAVNSVAAGQLYIDPTIVPHLMTYRRLLRNISSKYTDVIYLMSKGLNNERISEQLNLGVRTISNYRSHIRSVIKNDALEKLHNLMTTPILSDSCS